MLDPFSQQMTKYLPLSCAYERTKTTSQDGSIQGQSIRLLLAHRMCESSPSKFSKFYIGRAGGIDYPTDYWKT
jgi:hypothetical protein